MNIFVLDKDPKVAAIQQFDKHVVKMVLESAQILCAAFPDGAAPYKRTHYNHPSTVWARTCKPNYQWLLKHGLALAKEYTRRYEKTHKSQSVIEWCAVGLEEIDFLEKDLEVLTPFAQAMPEEYKCDNAVDAYRSYYIGEKNKIASWARSPDGPPDWWTV